jgi:hypothetical protein
MISVRLIERNVDEVLRIVKELKAQGLQQSVDFDFKWTPKVDDWINGNLSPSYADFFFYTEEQATMFSLRFL